MQQCTSFAEDTIRNTGSSSKAPTPAQDEPETRDKNHADEDVEMTDSRLQNGLGPASPTAPLRVGFQRYLCAENINSLA